MEINKHNYQEISSVKAGDRIVFDQDYIYTVTPKYIEGCNVNNEAIFSKIKVASKKMDFCREAYGYDPEEGYCPEYKFADYDAAVRLIRSIFDKMYPELKTQKDKFEYLLAQSESDAPKLSKSADTKFTVKVSTIKPKIIL